MKSKKTTKIEITLEAEDLIKALAKEHDASPEDIDAVEIFSDGTGIRVRGCMTINKQGTRAKETTDESK